MPAELTSEQSLPLPITFSEGSHMALQLLDNNLAWTMPHPPDLSQPAASNLFGNLSDLDSLRQQNLDLQERVEELDTFAHTVAHDLKGSFGALICFAATLKEDYDRLSAEQRQKCLDNLVNTAYKLNNVVDELLLLAEMREADVVLNPLYMAPIVTAAQHRLDSMIEDSKAEIVLPATWPTVQGYAAWVEEVWVNYLSNAIKYGGRPPRMELGADLRPDGMVRFWLRDNGQGLTLDQQVHLFKPFTRLDRVRADGHGLGLSVVQHIVNKLGGRVGVESVLGKGSVFSFTLRGCLS